jgi:hypothetical protein
VVVSHYHHLHAVGGVIAPEMSLSEFVQGGWGIERVVRFMNLWAEAMRTGHPSLTLCSYESLKRDTAETFARTLAFLGATIEPALVARAVEESSFERLRARERSSRTYQGASMDPQAFRFRRGAVGGHARELSEADSAFVDRIVSDRLDPVFTDYHRRTAAASPLDSGD